MEVDKQRRIAELRERLQRQRDEQEKLNQAEDVIKQYFTPNALERYGNIKIAHPETAVHIIEVVANAIQNGKLKNKIDDASLREILTRLSQKRDIKITRK